MVRKKKPAPPPAHIAQAVKQIEIPAMLHLDDVQDELVRVVKELKKHKITQDDICSVMQQASGKRYTPHHLRNNIMRVPELIYQVGAAWVLQCLGYEVDLVLLNMNAVTIKTPKGEG